MALELLAAFVEIGPALLELVADLAHGAVEIILLGDVVRRRPDVDVIDLIEDLAGERVEVLDALDLVAEELDPVRGLRERGPDLQDLALDAEGAAAEDGVVAPVLHVHELAEELVALDPLANLEELHLLAVELRRADAVDARDRGDDQDVAPREQAGGRGVAEPVDLVVDRGVLLDVEVLRRDVCLGLVVVVIGDEVLDLVFREELAELVAELRGQGLVVGDHERRALDRLDRGGHREGLAGPGGPEERRKALPRLDPLG